MSERLIVLQACQKPTCGAPLIFDTDDPSKKYGKGVRQGADRKGTPFDVYFFCCGVCGYKNYYYTVEPEGCVPFLKFDKYRI